MDSVGQFSQGVMMVVALVWGLTQVLKQVLPVNPQAIAVVMGLVVGGLGYASGYLTGHPFEVMAQVLLGVLGASGAHILLWKGAAPPRS